MELYYLKEFITLVEEGYYANAAEQLYISPSSLTRHIQSIEKELGEPLFLRTSRKVKLTSTGNEYYKYAKKIIELQEKFMDENIIQKRRERKVVVGYQEGISQSEILEWISSFKCSYPEIELEFVYTPSEHRFDMLNANKCDFLLTQRHFISSDKFEYLICIRDEYVFVTGNSHDFEEGKRLPVSSLPLNGITVIKSFAQYHSNFIELLKTEPAYRNVHVIEENYAIACALLENKLVLMPKLHAKKFGKPLSIIEISPSIPYEIVLVYKKEMLLSEKAKVFLHFFEQQASHKKRS